MHDYIYKPDNAFVPVLYVIRVPSVLRKAQCGIVNSRLLPVVLALQRFRKKARSDKVGFLVSSESFLSS